jgi:hypothetical protein
MSFQVFGSTISRASSLVGVALVSNNQPARKVGVN